MSPGAELEQRRRRAVERDVPERARDVVDRRRLDRSRRRRARARRGRRRARRRGGRRPGASGTQATVPVTVPSASDGRRARGSMPSAGSTLHAVVDVGRRARGRRTRRASSPAASAADHVGVAAAVEQERRRAGGRAAARSRARGRAPRTPASPRAGSARRRRWPRRPAARASRPRPPAGQRSGSAAPSSASRAASTVLTRDERAARGLLEELLLVGEGEVHATASRSFRAQLGERDRPCRAAARAAGRARARRPCCAGSPRCRRPTSARACRRRARRSARRTSPSGPSTSTIRSPAAIAARIVVTFASAPSAPGIWPRWSDGEHAVAGEAQREELRRDLAEAVARLGVARARLVVEQRVGEAVGAPAEALAAEPDRHALEHQRRQADAPAAVDRPDLARPARAGRRRRRPR